MKRNPRLGLAVLVLIAAGPAARAQKTGLREVARYDLPGSGDTGALQLDAEAKRLYAARGDRIDVLNAETGAKEGAVTGLASVRALALAHDSKRGFAAVKEGVAVFDTGSLAVVKTVSFAGKGPAALAYDEDTAHVYVSNETGGDLAVLDAASGDVVADLPLGGRLAGVACDGFARVYVNAQDRDLVHVVDSHTLKSIGDYPTAPGKGPTGMAVEDEGRRLFVPCLNGKLVVIDGDIGAVFRILKLEGKGPAVAAFGLADAEKPVGEVPWKGRILAATEDGTLNVGRMMAFVNYVAHDHVPLGAKPLGVAIEGDSQRAYVLVAASPSKSQVIVMEP